MAGTPQRDRKLKQEGTARGSHRKPLALLGLLTLLCYANTFGLSFALDAVALVQGDPRVHAATAENLGLILRNDYWWPSSVDTLYRPVTTASFLFNYAVLGNGENAAGYHVLNVLLHMANAWLVFHLAVILLRKPWTAFFAAALWAVHPIATESVANIAGRADLLAATCVLGGLLLYIRIMAMAGNRWRWAMAGLFAVAACGVFSKESAAILLGLMLLWDLAFGPGWRGGGARRLAAYAAVALSLLILVLVRHWVFSTAPVPEMPFVDNPLRGAGFWTARWTAIKIAGMDLVLLLWPLNLASERGFDQITLASARDPAAWLAVAAAGTILAWAIARRRKDPLMFWAVGLFGIALLPVSNLILIIGSSMAERFLYLPAIGFAIAVVALLDRTGARIAAHYFMAGLLVLLAGRTFARNRAWHDNLTLAQTDVHSAPRSARLQELLASSLFAQDPVGNLNSAIRAAEAGWEILRPLPPDKLYQQTPARLGLYYRLKGDAAGGDQARGWYERSAAVLLRAREASQAIETAYDRAQFAHGKPLATRVAYQPVYVDLGIAFLKLGRYGAAIEAWRYAREVDPRTPDLYDLLAETYLAQGDRRQAAVTLLEKTLLLGATAETLGQLATVYGEGSCAIERGPGWLRVNPACPQLRADLCPAYQDLAGMLLKARLPEPARQFAERAQKEGCGAEQR